MTWVDLAVLGVLAVSALLAFLRGLAREVLGVGAWIGAVVAAIYAMPTARTIARGWISEPAWIDPVAFLSVFLVTLIVLSVIARLIAKLVRGSVLGGVDRTLGLVFGLARGAALVILAYIVVGLVEPVDRWPASVLEARALTPAYRGASWVVQQLPVDYRPRIYAPPPGKEATAEALFRATPQGRALGGRVVDARSGDARTGDTRTGDTRPNDARAIARAGDARVGDARATARAGDAKVSDVQAGDARPGNAWVGDTRVGDPPAGGARAAGRIPGRSSNAD